jgi:lipopolysaccharide exporter
MSALSQPKQAFIKGALWTIGGRWLVRILGLVNTVVLARILLPADYGVVAMAMLLVGLIQAMSDVGVATALLRKKDIDEAEIHSAWTLRCMQGLAIALIIVVIAPFASMYFAEPRVQVVLVIMAACMALEGFGSLGTILAQRQLDFALDFRIQIIAKTVSILAAWLAAVIMADYRALVIGIVVGYVLKFALGYGMHPYRPKWTTARIADIWLITRWLMISSMALFLLRRSDEIIAAKIGSTASFGAYHVGSDLGRSPVEEIGPPLMRAFLPVLASFQTDRDRVNHVVIKTLSATSTLTMPIAVGMWSLSVLFVDVLLGAQWHEVAPFLGLYALVSLVQFAANPLSALLVLHGYTRTQSTAAWLELSAFALATLVLLPWLHLIGLVWARLIATSLNFVVMLVFARRLADLKAPLVLEAFWRPALGVLLMAIALHMSPALEPAWAWVELLMKVFIGVVFFTAWSLVTWHLAGRPDGLESTVIEYLKKPLHPVSINSLGR